jgi:tRNA(Ser,Leu) C12 N-acetylase TAN1
VWLVVEEEEEEEEKEEKEKEEEVMIIEFHDRLKINSSKLKANAAVRLNLTIKKPKTFDYIFI